MTPQVGSRLPEPLRSWARRAYHALRGWPAWAPEAAIPAAAGDPSPGARRAILLEHVDRTALGLEIGPSHSPVASRKDGFRVEILDHATRDALAAKYADHGVDTAAIEDVDFVWDGRPYAELTGRSRGYGWIIASHVIEHVPDMVGFLADCESILREQGVLSLAVPDKRYCFDRMRPHTGLQAVVDAHLESRTNHTPGRVAEYFLNVVALGGHIAWSPAAAADAVVSRFEFVHGIEFARNGLRAVRDDDVYLDIHAWCFTPSSFRLLIEDLHTLGMSPLRELSFQEGGSEFFVTLSREGQGHGIERMELLARIERELASATLPPVGPR